MTKQKVGMGRTVRCPRCKYENLAIDIWCERCGTPVDWQGTPSASSARANGHPKPARNGNGRPGALAALAGGLPWLKGTASKSVRIAPAPVAPAPAPAPAAPPPVAAARPPVAAAPPPAPAAPPAPPVQPMPPPAAAPVAATPRPVPSIAAAPVPVPAPAPARVFCPGCGQSNEASNKFCPRCGRTIAAVAAGGALLAATSMRRPEPRARRPRQPLRLPEVHLPRMTLPRMTLPRLRFPRVPMVAWAIAAVVLVLLIAPLAYVLSPSGRHLAASRTQPVLTKTGQPPSKPSSALAAAIPGVEAKTGLKYATTACPSSGPCLRVVSQSSGLNAAAIQFTTAATGGRQCVGYVYQDAGSWHFLDATCGLPGQLSPIVGHDATVHVPGQCANARDAASLHAGIVACLNDGSTAHVDGGPNYADGKLWWHLEKTGWMAHEFLITA